MAKNEIRLGLYEKAMPKDLSWHEKLALTKEAGFDWLEISIDETDEKLARLDFSKEDKQALRKAMIETEVPILTMCLSGHRKYPLGSHDEALVEKGMMILEKALQFSQDLGIRIIQLAGYDVYYEKSDELTQKRFLMNLKKAVERASLYGVVLGFETMETPFMDTCTKAMTYVNACQSPYLGVYPDIGNLTNASRITKVSVEDDLKNAEGHIFAAHLKEIVEGKYREISLGTGDTRYQEAIRELRRQGVSMFTAEFWYTGSPSWKQDLKDASDYFREKLDLGK